jgi:hypothetical protein
VDRAHLRKASQRLHEGVCRQVAGRGHEEDERLPGVSPFTHDQVAEETCLALLVVRREDLVARPLPYGVPNSIAEVGREPACVDVKHLVPAPRSVETEGDSVLPGCERVLELVAVVEDGLRRNGGLELEAGQLCDSLERVSNLRGLRLQLRVVGEILKAAPAAALVVVPARRLDARRARFDDLERDGLRVVSLHLRDARAHGVTREPAPDEHDEAVQPRHAVPAVSERVDVEFDLLVGPKGCAHLRRRREGVSAFVSIANGG